jgi:hypothetical protein
VLWGTEDAVKERLSDGISDLKMTRTPIMFNYPFSPADVVEYFRTYFGPTQKRSSRLMRTGRRPCVLILRSCGVRRIRQLMARRLLSRNIWKCWLGRRSYFFGGGSKP